MVFVRGMSITVSQGDFLSVTFSFSGYVLQEGDIVTLAILASPPIRYEQENAGKSYVVFEIPTKMPVGEYSYDISIKFADDKVQTLNWLRQGNLTIEEVARR